MDRAAPLHRPVLLDEVIGFLRPRDGGRYLDATVGAGGHAEAILDASGPGGQLLGLDRDPSAVAEASRVLARFGGRARVLKRCYSDLAQALDEAGWETIDGALFDLGVSSMQIDTAERGFSFQKAGPLDMRMDPSSGGPTAADLVNRLPEAEFRDILFRYGEEPRARQVVREIVRARERAPIETTTGLADVVRRAGGKRGGIDAATRTFQALRIAVNNELSRIEPAVRSAAMRIVPGGRVAVISFHSLEDRIVKTLFRTLSRACVCPPELPVCRCGGVSEFSLVTRRAARPTEAETRSNPRARSARLRVIERVGQKGTA